MGRVLNFAYFNVEERDSVLRFSYQALLRISLLGNAGYILILNCYVWGHHEIYDKL